jgi:hypothetical protein
MSEAKFMPEKKYCGNCELLPFIVGWNYNFFLNRSRLLLNRFQIS